MPIEPSIYLLKGKVQHYSWGGFQFIPQLLQLNNEEQKPYAEYWLGAHPAQPSTVIVDNKELALNDVINEYKEGVLGAAAAKKFDALPYLFKVLDVRQMLSIQVHPNKEWAKKSFENENEKGIPLTAPHRNYKDTNHKPELMVALSDFWLLHGFKPADQLAEILEAVPEFDFLVDVFEKDGYEGLYEKVMYMNQREVNDLLEPLIAKIIPLYQNNEFGKDEESFWAARAAETFCKNGQYDRGIFSIYFFNLLHLKKGEGIYQPAG
ncbi:MAG TPA: mannose-6-phosphate isomerase, class I, partial [Chitinophagaceae bacterium]|nr:mannose-6-phosphate isomerase, class I [Chitinophagaceae bacterium]